MYLTRNKWFIWCILSRFSRLIFGIYNTYCTTCQVGSSQTGTSNQLAFTVQQRTTLQNVFRQFTFLYFTIFFIPYDLLKIFISEISRISNQEDEILIFSKKCSKIQLLSWRHIFNEIWIKKDEKYYEISTINIMHRIKFDIYKLQYQNN